MARTVKYKGDLMFPSEYLSADDLDGKEFKLKIKSIEPKEMENKDGSKGTKFLLMFDGAEKGMILNTTNAEAIGALHGIESEKWIGKEITLRPVKVKAFGEITAAIRVK